MGDLIDLAAVGRASGALARWWDAYLDGGNVSVSGLEAARRELGTLPVQTGKLGRAVSLVLELNSRAPLDAIVDAVELLSRTVVMAGPTASPLAAHRESRGNPALPLIW